MYLVAFLSQRHTQMWFCSLMTGQLRAWRTQTHLHCNGPVKLVYSPTLCSLCLESSKWSHWAWNCLVEIRQRPPSSRPTRTAGVWASKPRTIMPRILPLPLHCSLRYALLAPTWEQQYSILLPRWTRLKAFMGLVHSSVRLKSSVKLSTSFLCASTFLFCHHKLLTLINTSKKFKAKKEDSRSSSGFCLALALKQRSHFCLPTEQPSHLGLPTYNKTIPNVQYYLCHDPSERAEGNTYLITFP